MINQAHADGDITGGYAIVWDKTVGNADAGLVGDFIEGASAETIHYEIEIFFVLVFIGVVVIDKTVRINLVVNMVS